MANVPNSPPRAMPELGESQGKGSAAGFPTAWPSQGAETLAITHGLPKGPRGHLEQAVVKRAQPSPLCCHCPGLALRPAFAFPRSPEPLLLTIHLPRHCPVLEETFRGNVSLVGTQAPSARCPGESSSLPPRPSDLGPFRPQLLARSVPSATPSSSAATVSV